GDDKKEIFKLLGNAFDEGASGLSTGLIYPPGIYSDTGELIEITGEALKRGGIVYATHMRSEGDTLLEAVDEAIRIGLETGIHLHISHLKASDEKNWGKLDTVLEKIADARQKGLGLTCDRYPYIASSTGLDAILPNRVYEGGREQQLMRLKNDRESIVKEMTEKHADEKLWDKVMISGVKTAQNKWMEGKTLSEIGGSLKKSPADCSITVLIEEDLQVDAIFFLMNEDNLKTILKLPYVMIGTDSSARSFNGITASGKPHPRGFGTFPRILGRYVREKQLLSVEDAVYKMTGLPAETFGIKNRGRIAQDYYADITVFDLNKICDTADYNDPFKAPTGIEAVFVNGRPVVLGGSPTSELPGRIIKRGDQ
ncbi:MAG TPA: D-aminoacylase, partial [Nitrospirae bacterium]|nr:D-aminoacylase [Nitrospirota bacterium]